MRFLMDREAIKADRLRITLAKYDNCPICGQVIRIQGQTTDGRIIGTCQDAFYLEQWESSSEPS